MLRITVQVPARAHIEARRQSNRQLGHGIGRLLADLAECYHPFALFGFNGS